MGNANVYPQLNTLMYEVEFPDGEIRLHTATVIADNLWSQVDPDGQCYVIFKSIINHHVDSSIVVTKESIYCFVNS